jgi:hypothetical protein
MPVVINGTTGITTPTESVATTIGVGGATPSASGAGITFPAVKSPSSNANTLDDYEEGTFTPVFLNTTVTYVAPTGGIYVKIGRQVFISLVVTTSALTRNGAAFEIGGLPFGVEDVQPAFSPTVIFPETGMNPSGGAGNMYGLFIQGASYARMYTIFSGASDNYVTMSYNDLQTGTNRIRISGCYRTS